MRQACELNGIKIIHSSLSLWVPDVHNNVHGIPCACTLYNLHVYDLLHKLLSIADNYLRYSFSHIKNAQLSVRFTGVTVFVVLLKF